MTPEPLDEAIHEVLSSSTTALTAREIVRQLRGRGMEVTRTDVNSRLYRGLRHDWFTRLETDSAPLWLPNEAFSRDLGDEAVRPVLGEPPAIQLYTWQQEAMSAWHRADRRGIVEAVTGSGKTRLGIAIAHEHVAASQGKVAIVVPSLVIQEQWVTELGRLTPSLRVGIWRADAKHSFAMLDVLVVTAQTGYKYLMVTEEVAHAGTGPLLIADEVHHYAAPSWRASLEAGFHFRLGLTATHHDPGTEERESLDTYFGGICFSFLYDRAIPEGVIAPFRLATCGVDFASAEERQNYELADEAARSSRRKLISEFGYPEDHREFIRYAQQRAEGDTWEPDVLLARRYLSAFSERRRLLAETSTKMDGLNELAGALEKAERTVIFTETKEAAHAAAERVNAFGLRAWAMTADTPTPQRAAILSAFANGEIQVLCGPKLLDEGMDVPVADLGIILAASKSRRQMIQRMGRVIRPEAGKRNAAFAILYVVRTNEDPAGGAHEAFFSLIDGVADAQKDFSVHRGLAGLPEFLFP